MKTYPVQYLDQQGDVASAATGPTAPVKEAFRDTGFIFVFFRHDRDETIFLKYQFNHNRAKQTVLPGIHAHTRPMANGAGNVYGVYYWYWNKDGDVLPALSSWNTGNFTWSFLAADQYKRIIKTIVINLSPPANEDYSSELYLIFTRLGTNGLDTYTTNKDHGTGAANLGITFIDPHTQIDKIGSYNEYTD